VEQWMKDNAAGSVYQVIDELRSSRSHTTKVLNDLVEEGKIEMVRVWQEHSPPINFYRIAPQAGKHWRKRRTFKQRFMEMLGLQ